MNNKFEKENEEEKLSKKCLLDRTLHKNTQTGSLPYPYISKALYWFSFKFSYISLTARLKKYFCLSFPKNIIHSSTHHKLIRCQF